MNSAQESSATIIDNLNELSVTVNKQIDIDKTGTVTDIINKKINNIEDFLNTRVINIYQRPWNKLEIKLKQKKLDEYYNLGPLNMENSDEEELSKKKKKGVEAYNNYSHSQLKLILNSSDKKKLKVDYDEEKCRINSIIVMN